MAEHRLGRNDPCFCGSGRKYKKCCLREQEAEGLVRGAGDFFGESDEEDDPYSLSKQREFGEIYQKDHPDVFFTSPQESDGCKKMSEILLDFADELLEEGDSLEEYKKGIGITVVGWNLSLVPKEQQEEFIDSFLESVRKSEAYKIKTFLYFLIEKKYRDYPFLNRMILDFDLVKTKGGFHLNVISSVTGNEDQEWRKEPES